MQLPKDHYKVGGETFGLKFRQTHGGHVGVSSLFQRAAWFNGSGHNIGNGDLSETDLCRIAREIKLGERFIVARLVKWVSMGDLDAPGLGVLGNAASLVVSCFKFEVLESETPPIKEALGKHEDIQMETLPRNELFNRMLKAHPWH